MVDAYLQKGKPCVVVVSGVNVIDASKHASLFIYLLWFVIIDNYDVCLRVYVFVNGCYEKAPSLSLYECCIIWKTKKNRYYSYIIIILQKNNKINDH